MSLQYTDTLEQVASDIASCDRCKRLRSYCQKIGREKRRAYSEWDYWARPVPGWGDPAAKIWIMGLAPGAHGANRTGRLFTGDRSGDFLFAGLFRAGLANQALSQHRDDGLKLKGVYISAAARCAPPGNKPTPSEIANCADFLDREWRLLTNVRVILALGKVGWDAALALARRHSCEISPGSAAFAHGAKVQLSAKLWLVGSYHVSQQNTFTGKLTPAMFDTVLTQCGQLC